MLGERKGMRRPITPNDEFVGVWIPGFPGRPGGFLWIPVRGNSWVSGFQFVGIRGCLDSSTRRVLLGRGEPDPVAFETFVSAYDSPDVLKLADPHDLPPGTVVAKVNATSVRPGELRGRPKRVTVFN
jgi:hypothetical protein